MLRIAHATDIHWMVPTPWNRLPGKRLLGSLNMHLKGRKQAFSRDVQSALVAKISQQKPDIFVLSGDITAMALEDEFSVAKDALAPLLNTVPSFIVPGNHDYYTVGARNSRRIETEFREYMYLNDAGVGITHIKGLRFIGLNPNKPGFFASGRVPQQQLDSLTQILNTPSQNDDPTVLVIHYPLISPNGNIYDGINHGLLNAAQLIDILDAAKTKPIMILHGHKHRGYRATVTISDGSIPTIDPGSSGMTLDKKHNHTGAFNIYSVDNGVLVNLERFIWDGQAFNPEEGGPYCSGW